MARCLRSRHARALAAVLGTLAVPALLMVSTGAAVAQPRVEPAPPHKTSSEADAPDEIVLWYFWRDRCPHCVRAETWLGGLTQKYLVGW